MAGPRSAGASAGYSGKPLVEKLGIREGSRVAIVGGDLLERSYEALLVPLPPRVELSSQAARESTVVHLFVTRREELETELVRLRSLLKAEAVLWVSWPKKASKVPTTVTEETIRELALPLGWVDVKVCAVTEIWSGLKLVVRKELRGMRVS